MSDIYADFPSEIMENRPFGKPIETKFHVIELSLLPPNSQGVMPAGIQRFPFEFLLPGSLPVSVSIPDRLDIFYRLIATLRRSSEDTRSRNSTHWFALGRIAKKSKLTATAGLRLVRAIDSAASIPSTDVQLYERSTIPQQQQRQSTDSDAYIASELFPQEYTGLSLDEQYDRLAYSLAGRSVDNYRRPTHAVSHGIRYRLGIDRTAVAIGASLGIEISLEPQYRDVKIRSILTKITEDRRYIMKIPGDYAQSRGKPETRTHTETVAMILKWAYGYPVDNQEIPGCSSKLLSKKYRKSKKAGASTTTTFDEESSLTEEPTSKEKQALKELLNSSNYTASQQDRQQQQQLPNDEFSSKLQNLKELDQPIQVSECFDGRFVLPMPTCKHFLRPSMSYDSISITHWLELAVTLEEQDGKKIKIYLETPIRLLNCRLVASDDKCQTLLPPPPSYDGSVKRLSCSDTFWEQRLALTEDSLWGYCKGCPCQARTKKSDDAQQPGFPPKCSSPPLSSSPEWGPPPSYSEN